MSEVAASGLAEIMLRYDNLRAKRGSLPEGTLKRFLSPAENPFIYSLKHYVLSAGKIPGDLDQRALHASKGPLEKYQQQLRSLVSVQGSSPMLDGALGVCEDLIAEVEWLLGNGPRPSRAASASVGPIGIDSLPAVGAQINAARSASGIMPIPALASEHRQNPEAWAVVAQQACRELAEILAAKHEGDLHLKALEAELERLRQEVAAERLKREQAEAELDQERLRFARLDLLAVLASASTQASEPVAADHGPSQSDSLGAGVPGIFLQATGDDWAALELVLLSRLADRSPIAEKNLAKIEATDYSAGVME